MLKKFHPHAITISSLTLIFMSNPGIIPINRQGQVYHISFRWSVSEDSQHHDRTLTGVCNDIFDKWIYQLENTKTSGGNNYHYQGFGHLRQKRRPSNVKSLAISLNGQLNGIEMSPASTAGIQALQSYVLKADTRVRGPYSDSSTYIGEDLIVQLFPWQEEIKTSISRPPDRRSINVVVDSIGNTGKSAFCKYMCWHYKIPILGWGKTGDLLHLVSKMPNKSAYIFDLSRSRPQDWGRDDIFSAMEGIKNGLFINTKYECSQVIMKHPHVWIFTNHYPNISAMSRDRWKIWKIQHNRLLPFQNSNPTPETYPFSNDRKHRELSSSPQRRSNSLSPVIHGDTSDWTTATAFARGTTITLGRG